MEIPVGWLDASQCKHSVLIQPVEYVCSIPRKAKNVFTMRFHKSEDYPPNNA